MKCLHLEKKENVCPPYKRNLDYERCLSGKEEMSEKWQTHAVTKIYYTTVNLLKAREKLKEGESKSNIYSDYDGDKRKRRVNRRLIDSSSGDNDEEEGYLKGINIPIPPAQVKRAHNITDYPTEKSISSLSKAPADDSNNSPVIVAHSQVEVLSTGNRSDLLPDGIKAWEVDSRRLEQWSQRLQSVEEGLEKILSKIDGDSTSTLHQEPDVSLPENLLVPCATVHDIVQLGSLLKERTEHESVLR